MKKIDIIFDDITIINFGFFWKLLKRYAYFLFITPIVVFAISYHFYVSQHEIYMAQVSFKTVEPNTGDSASSAIADLIGEKSSSISPSEIKGIAYSMNFIQGLAKEVMEYEQFATLNLNSIYAKKLISTEEMFKHCDGNENCTLDSLRGILSSFFTIEQDQEVFTKFTIQVKTLDRATTKFLVNTLQNKIIEYRVSTIKHSLEEQRKISDKLINEKKYDLETNDVQKLIQERKKLTSKKYELKEYIYVHSDTLRRERIRLEEAEFKYQHDSRKEKETSMSQENLSKWKRLRNEMIELNEDIAAVKNTDNSNSLDSEILNKLRTKQNSLQKELSEFQKSRGVSSLDFEKINRTDNDGNRIEEYGVEILRKQVEAVEEKFNKAFLENQEIDRKIENLNIEIEKHAPSLKYLELLNKKKMQISLLESTIVSDFMFDKIIAPAVAYKRNSLGMIIIFSVIITIFLLILFIMIRFFFDSRVFDEEELVSNFKGLEIIGNSPDFN